MLRERTNIRFEIGEEKEVVDMCKAWDDMAKESMELGIECGIELGDARRVVHSVSNLMKREAYSLEEGYDIREYDGTEGC